MKIALLGYPQAGRRTLFTLLTTRKVSEGRKPGEAVEGVAFIRDSRVDRLNEICRPERKAYAENHFVLCPDIIEDPARAWLEAARKCDLLCFVVRAFSTGDVYHPAGSVDAARDLANIRAELIFADMELTEKRLTRIGKEKRAGQTPEQANEERTLMKCMATLEAGKRLSDAGLDDRDLASIRSLGLVTLIPQLVAYNVDEGDLAKDFGPMSLAVSVRIETEIMAIDNPAEREEYLESIGLASSGVDRMNAAAYSALGLMSFYTIGKDEVRAWTIRQGAHAPTAAGKIHTDIERGFIRVEVIKYDDLVAAGSEQAVKAHGKMQLKGKDYVIEDSDICHFLFNV
jgi:hypothetical protein